MMKHSTPIVFLMLCFILLFNQTTYAQFSCGNNTVPSGSSSALTSNNCFNGNERNFDFDLNYSPDATDEILTIRYNVHIMQFSDTDPRNFEDGNTTHETYLNNLLNRMNQVFSNVIDPVYEGNTNPSGFNTIDDTRIRLELQNIYYRVDPIGWRNDKDLGDPNTNTCGPYNYDNYAVNEDCELNIFFLGSNLPTDGCRGPGLPLGGEDNNYINHEVWNQYDAGADWWTLGYQVAHEVGHVLGLHHVWFDCPPIRPDVYCPHTGDFCGTSDNDCSNNMMGYSGEQLHISPSQAGHMRELLLNTWRSKMLNMDYDANQSITVSSNETWSTSRAIRGDITIQSGATLTVECNLLMATDAKIVVERGARLHVDGGCITTKHSSCGDRDYWKGIEVLGHTGLSQTTTNQGVVELDDATIEYASNGITTGTNGIGWQGGGIIYADNTVFRNNRRSVEFTQYTIGDNLSYFSGCTFEINDDYPQSDYIGMVTMWDVRGVEFTDCDFTNTSTTVSNEEHAIYTIDAAYSVISGSTFNGFEGGVYATNSNTTNSFTIDDANFTDNALGIYAGSVDNIVATNNTMTVGHHRTVSFNHGVYLINSTGYQVEANDFNGDDILFGGRDPVGVLCYNTGDDYNKIYRNDYTGFLYGNRAIGDNRNNTTHTGLEFICNTNSNNTYIDFLVSIDVSQSSSLSGIKTHQGSSNESAGNTFSLRSSPTGSDFNNGSNWGIIYWYDNGTTKQPLNTVNIAPSLTSNAHTCASELAMMMALQGGIGTYENIFAQHQPAYDSKMASYRSLLDGGDTDKLEEEIRSSRKNEAAQINQKLLELSPWLSVNTLQAAIENQDLFSKDELILILSNNPDALRNQLLLNNLKTVLTTEQIDNLKDQVFSQITQRTRLESEIGEHFAHMQTAVNNIIRYYLSQNEIEFTSVRRWLEEKRSVNAAYARVESWLQEQKPDEALKELNSIPKDFDLIEKQLAEYREYESLTILKVNAMKEGRTIADFTKSEVASLVEIADNEIGRAGVQAKGILNFFYGYEYEPRKFQASAEGMEKGSLLKSDLASERESIEESPIHIFPNPTKGEITFNYDFDRNLSEGVLQIVDLNGKVIQIFSIEQSDGKIQWDTSNLEPGIYLYRLMDQTGFIASGRFLILR